MSHDLPPSQPPRPPRRIRYSGAHPRNFDDKYKEHRGDATTLAKVTAAGKTPAGSHRPIMVSEVIFALNLRPGQTVIDCTLGHGAHTSEFLREVAPNGHVIAFDVDPIEIKRTTERLRGEGFGENQLTIVSSNFAGLAMWLVHHGHARGVDAVFVDLGVSSMQLDDPKRGFSYKSPGPPDMRLNPQRGIPASELLAKMSRKTCAQLLRENSDEPLAEELSNVLAGKQFTNTIKLAESVRTVARKTYHLRSDSTALIEKAVRRVFQSLRIAVNDEFGALDTFLRTLPHCVAPDGHVAILTFHSGEDRRVKRAFNALAATEEWYLPDDPSTRATPAEHRANPRSSSARLRVITRC